MPGRLGFPDPARALRLVAFATSVANAAVLVWFDSVHAHYFADDLYGLWQVRTQPFLRYLATPIDVHPVPLHRLLTAAMTCTSPLDFWPASLVLGIFFLLGVLFLYLGLEAIRSTPANAVFCAWYTAHVYQFTVFAWWTAALHRLPYLCLLSLSFYAYARFRRSRSKALALVVLLSAMATLGFFEKGVLVAPVLAGVEASAWASTPTERRRGNAMLIAAVAACAAAYLLAWPLLVGERWRSLYLNPRFFLDFSRISWAMLGRSAFGFTDDGEVATALFGFGLIALVVVKSRGSIRSLLPGFVVVTLSLGMTGLSRARSALLGLSLASHVHRYYPDAMFLLVLFIALAWSAPLESPRMLPAASHGRSVWLRVGLAAASLFAVTFTAQANATSLLAKSYGNVLLNRNYLGRLSEDVKRFRKEHRRLALVDGPVPQFVDPIGRMRLSLLLGAFGVSATYGPPGPGYYRVTGSGHIVPARR
jgi:hypothetical protein